MRQSSCIENRCGHKDAETQSQPDRLLCNIIKSDFLLFDVAETEFRPPNFGLVCHSSIHFVFFPVFSFHRRATGKPPVRDQVNIVLKQG